MTDGVISLLNIGLFCLGGIGFSFGTYDFLVNNRGRGLLLALGGAIVLAIGLIGLSINWR